MSYFPRKHSKGFSLVELMISIAMGLALLLVLLVMFENMTKSGNLGQAQQRMSENAQQAFQIIGLEMRQAGFNPRQARTSTPAFNALFTAPGETAMPIFGCTKGFTNGIGTGAAANIGLLTCATAGTETFAIQYEADRYSANITSAGVPADCRGFAVPQLTQPLQTAVASAGSVNYFVVENRYFISDSGLSCAGNGGSTPFDTPKQPLVRNIEKMELKYGLTQANPDATTSRYVAGYLTPEEIGPGSGTTDFATVDAGFTGASPAVNPSARWGRLVKTVRVCLIVKGETRTLTQDLTPDGPRRIYGYYYGCSPEGSNTPIEINDQYPRRSYFMHYALRNRIFVQ